MNLDVLSAGPYLLERSLLNAAALVDGGFRVEAIPGRNRNLRVENRLGSGHLIKQPDAGELASAETVRAEADFYAFCQEEDAATPLARLLAPLRLYDRERTLLAFDLLAGRPLWEEYEAHPPGEIPAAVPRALGEALGTLHATFHAPELFDHARLAGLFSGLPGVLSVHRPTPEALGRLSGAHHTALRIVQGAEGLGEELDTLAAEWREETVIHGDVKSSNVLVLADGGVRLVDWELVQRGDPAWDVAGVLQDFLRFWIHSMPLSHELTPQQRAAQAKAPLAVLQEGVRAFWDGYATAAKVPADLLPRSVRFSAARLLQSAHEHSQGRATIPAAAVLMLQVSVNVFADPASAATNLYGLDV